MESLGISSSASLEMLSEDAKMHVPEVVHCEFHYFDGSEWLEEWDSAERKSLPNAVEVTLRLDPPPERWKPKPAEKKEAEVAVDEKRDRKESLPTDEELRKPVYRQVIALTPSRNDSHTSGGFGESVSSSSTATRRSTTSRSAVSR
jgi:hypothetical protein